MNTIRKSLGTLAAGALMLQPMAASAQSACLTDEEVSAIAIYSVPSLLQAVRTRCGAELSASGYLAQRGDGLSARYVRLQNAVWPRAKAGLVRVLLGSATRARSGVQSFDMFANLPDNALRPLADAYIVQESSPRIQLKHCRRIERVAEAMAPIDPEVAGTLLGVLAGFAASDWLPVCPDPRR